MAIKVQVQQPNIKLATRKIEREFKSKLKQVHKEVTLEAKHMLIEHIIKADKVATGTLLRSVTSKLIRGNSTDGIASEVGFKKPGSTYAVEANYGFGPGRMVPLKRLRKWARAVGFPVDRVKALQNKIFLEGTENEGEDAFFEKAVKDIERMVKKSISAKLTELKRNYK